MTRKRTRFRRRTSDAADPRQLRLGLRHGRCGRRKRSKEKPDALPPYPILLLRRTVVPFGDLSIKAPPGQAWLYELFSSTEPTPFYAGFTRQNPHTRLAGHISFARHHVGSNIQLETRLRQMAEGGETLVMRLVGLHPLDAIEAAEVALIVKLKARLGTTLLNQSEGGEHAPVGRLVCKEERYRAAMARRARQRDPAYRLHQALASARPRHTPEALDRLLADFATADPAVPTRTLCRRHGMHEAVLLGVLAGTARHLVVDPDLLTAACAAQARRQALRAAKGEAAAASVLATLRAYLASQPGTALADVARAHSLDPRRLQEAVRRREFGIPDNLARAVRARMDEDSRLRCRALAQHARRTDRRLLRRLLTAYARPGSTLTQSGIAARLSITQSAVSRIVAGRKGQPLPRRLLRACLARTRAVRYGAGRSGDLH